MKKIFYFFIFLFSGSIYLFDSFLLLNRISFPVSLGLGFQCIGIGILFLLIWMNLKEMSLAVNVLIWGIALLNILEMNKEGKSFEDILFFILSRIALGIVFYISVYESVEIAKKEYKEKKR